MLNQKSSHFTDFSDTNFQLFSAWTNEREMEMISEFLFQYIEEIARMSGCKN